MITTININKEDVIKYKTAFPNGVNEYLVTKIDLIENKTIKKYPISKEKILIGVNIPLESWKKINHWIIDATTDKFKYNLRDAVLTLLEE